MKLRDWLPQEFFMEFHDSPAAKHLDVVVVNDYTYANWPGNHKHVYNWVELENGYAVGWNENPSRGWAFPVVKLKEEN